MAMTTCAGTVKAKVWLVLVDLGGQTSKKPYGEVD